MSAILDIVGLNKSFGRIHALTSVNLSVQRGEICGIMGPNGAGKTVLFNIISGLITPNSGHIYFGNKSIDLITLHAQVRHSLGIRRTYQHIKLFGGMSVIENAMVGLGPVGIWDGLREASCLKRRRLREKSRRKEAAGALSQFGERLAPYAEYSAMSLSYANRRRLEFASALMGKPELILLDEPTAGMNPHETFELAKIVYRFRNQGLSFLIIEHKMFFLEDIADKIAVFAEGHKIAEGSVGAIRKDNRVKEAYLGRIDVA